MKDRDCRHYQQQSLLFRTTIEGYGKFLGSFDEALLTQRRRERREDSVYVVAPAEIGGRFSEKISEKQRQQKRWCSKFHFKPLFFRNFF
jgi:hypothetical protein